MWTRLYRIYAWAGLAIALVATAVCTKNLLTHQTQVNIAEWGGAVLHLLAFGLFLYAERSRPRVARGLLIVGITILVVVWGYYSFLIGGFVGQVGFASMTWYLLPALLLMPPVFRLKDLPDR